MRGRPRSLLIAADGSWSIQENAGHLLDLEELWDARLSDYLAGAETLREADLTNRKTYLADHNAADAGELAADVRSSRRAFLERCRGLTADDFARVAVHPRLQTPMRLIDLLTFVAEHDDHHLARIEELRQSLGDGEPGGDGAARGRIEAIHLGGEKGGKLIQVDEVEAVAGHGLAGGRYHRDEGTKDRKQITLIEAEAMEAAERDYGVELVPGESRRNVTTRGVALNHLIGRTFHLGEAELRGVKLCEPCGYLEKLTGKEMVKMLRHRGGLRAEIVSGGSIRIGDTFEVDS